MEGFGKLGRNIRGLKRVGSVIRWLMVRLEFHEALRRARCSTQPAKNIVSIISPLMDGCVLSLS